MKEEQESVDNLKKIFEKLTHEILDGYKRILLEILDKRLENKEVPQRHLPNKIVEAYKLGLNDGYVNGLNEARKLIQETKV